MRSLELLPALRSLPVTEEVSELSFPESVRRLRATDGELFAIEVSEGAEETLGGLSEVNVDDDIVKAYEILEPDSSISVYEDYGEKLAMGQSNADGFIHNLKGKVAELKAEDVLEDHFPGRDFELAYDPSQRARDLRGVSSDGTEDLLVQVKMRQDSSIYKVLDRMRDDPDIPFAVNTELYDRLIEKAPELSNRLIDLNISNIDLTTDVREDLSILASNSGFDIPDTLSDILPYVGEVILGIRLIMDIVSTERELSEVALPDRSRMHALRALLLMSKFGVTTVCSTVGGMAGGSAGTLGLPGVGTAVGGIAGSLTGVTVATMLNRGLKPRTMQIALRLTGLEQDDVFYLRNKPVIDGIGASLASTTVV